eukprot:gnl/Carplike_NY0171/5830_a7987_216.p2 GENE.gnl/Carplike_NY0171/5830_a7987_216~~gnl/Carplike_NY0171/5830_a7987_216.p2  ORF type:complete len:109 (+),score=21.71 gnl/Carplike_NY0171/5830_a7987_216:578-904(+)
MPLRPIDMQVILPRVQSFKDAKETIVHKEANAQHQQQLTNAQMAEQKLKQVNTYQQKEEEKIKDDNKEKGQSQKRKAKKKKEEDSEKTEDKLSTKNKGLGYHRFDMKV